MARLTKLIGKIWVPERRTGKHAGWIMIEGVGLADETAKGVATFKTVWCAVATEPVCCVRIGSLGTWGDANTLVSHKTVRANRRTGILKEIEGSLTWSTIGRRAVVANTSLAIGSCCTQNTLFCWLQTVVSVRALHNTSVQCRQKISEFARRASVRCKTWTSLAS